MPTYSKETALFDTGKIGDDINDAAGQVNKYITQIGDTGIKVHPYDSTNEQVDTDNYTKIDANGMEVYQNIDGASTKVASFGSSGAQIGQNGAAHISILPTGLKIGGESGVECFEIESTNGAGESIFETYSVLQEGDASVSVDLTGETWWNPVSNSELVVSCILKSVYTGEYMSEVVQMEFVYGQSSTATKQATVGGRVCTFTGVYDGGGEFDCTVNANAIFVFQSIGLYRPTSAFSPAFGFGTRQIGSANAYGGYSSSFGVGLIPSGTMQTVVGKYNEEDTNSDYAFIVGKGASNSSRSNAMEVDWLGNIKAAGDITDGGGNVLSNKIDASTLADYVIEQDSDGSWRYRKWHSGKIEAWFNDSITMSATTQQGNLYRRSATLAIPSGIFSITPGVIAGSQQSDNTIVSVKASASSPTSIAITDYRTNQNSSTQARAVRIYAWQNPTS